MARWLWIFFVARAYKSASQRLAIVNFCGTKAYRLIALVRNTHATHEEIHWSNTHSFHSLLGKMKGEIRLATVDGRHHYRHRHHHSFVVAFLCGRD
jgi:hypothetical protein